MLEARGIAPSENGKLTLGDVTRARGQDGFVYVVRLSDHVAHMAGKRQNVVTFTENLLYTHSIPHASQYGRCGLQGNNMNSMGHAIFDGLSTEREFKLI